MSVVAEDHDAVLHKAPLILAVGEKSRVPKLSPVTVMELLPVRALLRTAFEMTDASNV